MSDLINDILHEVDCEVTSAMAKHEGMKSRHEAYAVLLEEVDEFWDEVKKNPKKMDVDTATEWHLNMRQELIQIAAMAVQAIHDLGLDTPHDRG